MKISKLIGQRIKEVPSDAQSKSHIFLIRGGYIKNISSGIYSLLPLAKRICSKIESIIRDEMNHIDGQEVLMPVVLSAELWKKSGRYSTVDESLLRFKDRNDKEMVLAMTHEEAVCHLVKNNLTSHKQLPMMLYQIQTKYRDEARPRAGLIRVREFTMKDAYSFHKDSECLKNYYQEVFKSYERIFKKIGLKNVLSIQSDNGIMGGNVSHEFMAIADIGEDGIIASKNRQYLANKEIACSRVEALKEKEKPLEKVFTPNMKNIQQVSNYLKVDEKQTCKAVFFQSKQLKETIFVMIRGDIEVNETKLKNHLKISHLVPASELAIENLGSCPGFASCIGLKEDNLLLIVDPSVVESNNLVVGANQKDYHYKNFNFSRDCSVSNKIVDLATAKAGDICLETGEKLEELRGIEVGNIFQLGKKYAELMECSFLNASGKSEDLTMGCYGIGVGRSLAAVIEQSYDDFGPIWPLSISPFHLHIIILNAKKDPALEKTANEFYEYFKDNDLEVLIDDRDVNAGVAFSEADLIGIPYRVIFSPRNLNQGLVEFTHRSKEFSSNYPIEEAKKEILHFIKQKLAKI